MSARLPALFRDDLLIFQGERRLFAESFVTLQRNHKNDANMAREDIVQKWLDHVHEDVSAAEDLHKTGHQLYVDG